MYYLFQIYIGNSFVYFAALTADVIEFISHFELLYMHIVRNYYQAARLLSQLL